MVVRLEYVRVRVVRVSMKKLSELLLLIVFYSMLYALSLPSEVASQVSTLLSRRIWGWRSQAWGPNAEIGDCSGNGWVKWCQEQHGGFRKLTLQPVWSLSDWLDISAGWLKWVTYIGWLTHGWVAETAVFKVLSCLDRLPLCMTIAWD